MSKGFDVLRDQSAQSSRKKAPLGAQQRPTKLLGALGLGLLLSVSGHALAQVAAKDLLSPPDSAERFTILTLASTNGYSARWVDKDGVKHARDSWVLRGMANELDESTRYGRDGMPKWREVRGSTSFGDASELFEIKGPKAHWKSQVDQGSKPYAKPAYYVSYGGTQMDSADLLEAILKAPNKSLDLLPSGKATATELTRLDVGPEGKKITVIAYAITGISNSPFALWATKDGSFFASAGWISVIKAGYEDATSKLISAQDEALAQQSPAIAHAFLKDGPTTVAFSHVKLYDADQKRFLTDQTVVIDKGLITQSGPSASVKIPKQARIVSGKGKTLVPGLWDNHQHIGDDFSGPALLSLGITSVRDPGNDNSLTLTRAKRQAEQKLLMPHVYASVLIDGKGPNTAQIASVAETLEQGLSLVDKAKAEGFKGVKFYGTLPKAFVPALAARAHELGLHVHGHVPAGMKPSEAIAAGYDEITHIYFVMMEAMPQDVIDHSNGILRMQGMGMYAANVDLTKPPMVDLIGTMAEKKITSDPTLVVVESLLTADNGQLSPAYAPFVGTLPPAVERNFKAGGLEVKPGFTRAQYKQGFKKLGALVKTMYAKGVPIVAGTDGSGLELVRELELYVEAGLSPAEALETATLAPAKLQGVDQTTGSIKVGKKADLVLVEGDPSRHIGDLRHTRLVVMDGVVMDADALRKTSGFSGRPK